MSELEKPLQCPVPDCNSERVYIQNINGKTSRVVCFGCNMTGPVRPSPAEAIAAWRGIPRQSDLAALRAQLAEAQRVGRELARLAELYRGSMEARARYFEDGTCRECKADGTLCSRHSRLIYERVSEIDAALSATAALGWDRAGADAGGDGA